MQCQLQCCKPYRYARLRDCPLARARFTQPNPHISVLPLSGSERVERQGTAWVQHCSIAGAQRRAMMMSDELMMEKMHIIITQKYI